MGDDGTTRRTFLKQVGLAGAAALADDRESIAVDPEPRHGLSPYLYMQFMEPLGVTDSSVAAAWDAGRDRWRPDVIEATKRLGPTMLRWGGCFASYYRWKEGVGPRDRRIPMLNLCWGGVETNQVGTAEFVDFCRRVGAEPLMCVNFESDGRKYWMRDPKGSDRFGSAEEAAEWVAYANDPADPLRRGHGAADPLRIRFWQIGNETSYEPKAFDGAGGETVARKTLAFAKAMRAVDPEISLIAWGEGGWVDPMLEIAGGEIRYLAFHHMFNPDRSAGSPLRGIEYRKDPARTWEHLMEAWKTHDRKIRRMRDQVRGRIPLALTECHFALPGRNRCEVLSTWAAGVANARLLNLHERHADVLKIATLADFCGTRWQVNAVMIPVPGGASFLMPVSLVMSLYRHHSGERTLDVRAAPSDLDVTASRTGDTVFLHVVNTNRTRSVGIRVALEGLAIAAGRVFELAADPEFEVFEGQADRIAPVRKDLPPDGSWTFPAASVSAVEIDVRPRPA
ncbi:MAG: alpha-L-arabinofuranosidase [Planctomycetes bacterium]|nr:alpha-L-arabinofuranosidase [Planctomycetota bacterium]